MRPHVRRFVFALSAVVAGACGADKTTSPSVGAVDVFTLTSIFSPLSVTIGVGDTVRFNIAPNADGEGHDVTFDHTAGAPANIPVTTVATVIARVFAVRGTFAYQCFVHPGMNGVVVVH